MRTVFVVNPISDFGRSVETWKQVSRELASSGIEVVEVITQAAGHATTAARRALADGAEQIVAFGGDGTLNEVVNGYLQPDGKPINPQARLCLLPSGTGSDFKKTVGIHDLRAGMRALATDNTVALDAGRVEYKMGNGAAETRFFINMVNVGLGGDVSGFVNRWRGHLPRWVGGKARFSLAAVCALGRYRRAEVTLTLNSGPGEAPGRLRASSNLIVVANGRFAGGGMLLAPNARPDDGMFDVVITDGAGRLDVIRELPRIRRGGYIKNPKVSETRASRVSIDSDRPMALDIDGETEGFTPATMAILPSVIRFAV